MGMSPGKAHHRSSSQVRINTEEYRERTARDGGFQGYPYLSRHGGDLMEMSGFVHHQSLKLLCSPMITQQVQITTGLL
jgi:hypothetical protein